MSINANFLVSITPRILSAGSADLVTNGLVLTKNSIIPSSDPALEFTTAQQVGEYFGMESAEYEFAAQYFTGVNNQQKAPEALFVARRISEEVPAWLSSAPLSLKLADLKSISDGSINLIVNGETKAITGIDLSGATSLSEAIESIATAISGVSGAYDSNRNVFTLITETTGDNASIEYATASTTGTDLGALLGFTQQAGAVLSEGSNALTEAENLNLITAVSRNWVGFTTLWETTLEEATAMAEWADIDDDYVLVDWSTDTKMLNQSTQQATKAYELSQLNFNCLCEVYGTAQYAALMLACGASIDWSALNGIKTWFAKTTSGLNANVVDDSVATSLDNLRVNYLGAFATRNAEFIFINRGCMLSGIYGFLDTLYGMIWFKARIQRSIMDGFAMVNRAPYNPDGYAFIESWLLDPINDAKYNGIVNTGLALSQSQTVQLLSETGNRNISLDLYSKGYWYKIEDPSANVRSKRGSPRLGLWYAYAGSIQSISMNATAII